MKMTTMPALKVLFSMLDETFVGRINDYIDENRVRLNDHSDQLVGQIKQDRHSAQLQFDMNDQLPQDLGLFLSLIHI